MYKVMLVDDDFPVLEYLKKVIPWEALNFSLIGTYQNGQRAYDQAMIDMPDILITDIGMPVMDGLQLIDRLREKKANLCSVVLSCHDEFKFAVEAIKLNVVEYILKESLQPSVLIDLLNKIKMRLDDDSKIKQQIQDVVSLANEKSQRFKNELIASLTDTAILDEASWSEQALQIGLDFTRSSYIPVLCCINRYDAAKKRYFSENLLAFSLQNVIHEIVTEVDEQRSIYFTYNGKQGVLLFPVQDFLKTNIYGNMQAVLAKIDESLRMFLKFSVTMIIGSRSSDSAELRTNIKQLLASGEPYFYLDEGCITKLDAFNFSFSEEDLFAKYIEATQQFQELILKEKAAELRAALDHWIGIIGENKFRPQVVKEWGLKILLDLRIKIKSMQYFDTRFSEEVVHQNLLQADTLEHFSQVIWDNLDELLRVIHSVNAGSKRREIIEAQRYIINHINRKISLSEVAGLLHLNSAYFSRLFKKETNENFVDYVIRLKMEKACQYLNHGNQNIEQISQMLGFDSKSYFIRTFRKSTGMLPLEYRLTGSTLNKG